MSFIVRIMFSGLMAFVPSDNGNEVTVLLLNSDPSHQHLSDGSALPQHTPVLFGRGGTCSGQCPDDDLDIAQIMWRNESAAAALDALGLAVEGGGAWIVRDSDLSLSGSGLSALDVHTGVRGTSNGQPLVIPTSSTEREDFSWIAKLSEICPSCTLDPALLGTNPPAGLIAARLHLRNGKVYTYSVARIGPNVTPVHFQRLDGTGDVSSYSQAIASWVAADIEVSGDSITIEETTLGGNSGRSMTLSPDQSGKVEIAVLNLPPFVPPASTSNAAPQVGKHFEMYYELTEEPPAIETRLVPLPGAAPGTGSYPSVTWASIHPQSAVWSDLLNSLRLDVGRGPYDRVLCPPFVP